MPALSKVEVKLGFSSGSSGKESACNVGDLGSIPVLGRSSGEGKGLLFFSLHIFVLHTKKLHFHYPKNDLVPSYKQSLYLSTTLLLLLLSHFSRV